MCHNTYPEFVPPDILRCNHLNANTYNEYWVKCSEYNARVDVYNANGSWVCDVAILICDKELQEVLGVDSRIGEILVNNDFLVLLEMIEEFTNAGLEYNKSIASNNSNKDLGNKTGGDKTRTTKSRAGKKTDGSTRGITAGKKANSNKSGKARKARTKTYGSARGVTGSKKTNGNKAGGDKKANGDKASGDKKAKGNKASGDRQNKWRQEAALVAAAAAPPSRTAVGAEAQKPTHAPAAENQPVEQVAMEPAVEPGEQPATKLLKQLADDSAEQPSE